MARTDFDLDGDGPEATVYGSLYQTMLSAMMAMYPDKGEEPPEKPLHEMAEGVTRELAAIVIENLQQAGHMDREMAGPGPNDEI
jgi:hypothetical protein